MTPDETEGLTPNERFLVNAFRRFLGASGHLGALLLVLGSILLAFGTGRPWLFWSGASLSTIGAVHQVVTGPRFSRLAADGRQARARARERSRSLQAIMKGALRLTMVELPVDFSRARISVYRHRGDRFILVARVSESRSLEELGRSSYPQSEGLIARAWDRGAATVRNLPADREQWNLKCEEEYGIAVPTAAAMSMQARSLIGQRLDVGGANFEPVGLIVMESLMPLGVNGRTLDAFQRSPAYPLLRQVLLEVVQCLDEQDVEDLNQLSVAA